MEEKSYITLEWMETVMNKKSYNNTTKIQQLKKRLIKAVHISQRYVNYYKDNKDEYKKLLKKHFEVESSKFLTVSQLIALLDYLNFKTSTLNYKDTTKASDTQVYKIKQLWEQYADDKSDRALIHFLSRYNQRILVLKIENYPAKVIQKGIIAIKKTLSKDNANDR